MPERDNDLEGKSVIRSKGALHYITETEIVNSRDKNNKIDAQDFKILREKTYGLSKIIFGKLLL